MTAATRCDQGMSEMLGIADLVLREFKKEHLCYKYLWEIR